MRNILTVYAVVIVALVGIVFRHFNPDDPAPNSVFTGEFGSAPGLVDDEDTVCWSWTGPAAHRTVNQGLNTNLSLSGSAGSDLRAAGLPALDGLLEEHLAASPLPGLGPARGLSSGRQQVQDVHLTRRIRTFHVFRRFNI